MAYQKRSYESFSQEDDFFSLLDQSLSFDYYNSFVNPLKDLQTHETWFSSSSQESINAYYSLSNTFDDDHMFISSFHDLQAISTLSQDVLNESWSEIYNNTYNNNDQVQPKGNEISRANSNMEIVLYQEEEEDTRRMSNKKRRYIRDQDHEVTLMSKEALKQYYYMPIAKVAKELNIGLTLLKKRCRELDVHRWPHRKLTSLQSLINNHKEELWKMEEGDVNKDKLMKELEILEKEKKKIEENPNLEYGDNVKKIRQARFKQNFNRRRLLSLTSSTSTSSSVSSCEQELVSRESKRQREI